MGKPISTKDLPEDLPEGLDVENLGAGSPAQNPAAPERRTASAAAKEYAPSDYTVEKLNKLPKEDIKKALGIDIDFLVKNCKKYGVLEALAAGEYTPQPITVNFGNNRYAPKIKAVVRIYSLSKEPRWGCEVHPVKMKYELDADGKFRMDENGKYVMTVDRNPLKEGEFLSYDNKPFTAEEMDHLRLTGHLGEPKRGFNSEGEEISTIISVDPWNNHELCTTNSKVVRMHLFPKIWAMDENKSRVVVTSHGCTTMRDTNGVYADIELSDLNGNPLKSANTGKNRVLVPVGRDAVINIAAEGDRKAATLCLSAAQVGRLSPSVTYYSKDKTRVVSYLTAKQLGEISSGHPVWAGDPKEGLSFRLEGEKGSLVLSPVKEQGYSKPVQYNVATGKVEPSIDYKYAKQLELSKKEQENIAKRAAMSEQQNQGITKGAHV